MVLVMILSLCKHGWIETDGCFIEFEVVVLKRAFPQHCGYVGLALLRSAFLRYEHSQIRLHAVEIRAHWHDYILQWINIREHILQVFALPEHFEHPILLLHHLIIFHFVINLLQHCAISLFPNSHPSKHPFHRNGWLFQIHARLEIDVFAEVLHCHLLDQHDIALIIESEWILHQLLFLSPFFFLCLTQFLLCHFILFPFILLPFVLSLLLPSVYFNLWQVIFLLSFQRHLLKLIFFNSLLLS